MKSAKTVDSYIADHPKWGPELKLLQKVLRDTELEEQVKWGMPVYTIKNKNVIGITGFKNFFGIWFYQGVFLSDPKKLLRNAQEGKTKAMRHLNFAHKDEMDFKLIKAYVREAIENEKAGKRVKIAKKKLAMPPLLAAAFKKDKKLDAAFKALSLTKQNDFKDYLLSAKREATKASRLQKILPMIKEGIGMNDKYKKK